MRLALIVGQLILLLLAIRQLDILAPQYRRLTYLAVPAFLLNHALPRGWRARAFTALSLLGVFFALGEPAEIWRALDWPRAAANFVAVIGAGSVLIAICRLPLGFWTRVLLLCAAAGVLIELRLHVHGSILERASYALAGMFMLRIMLYLYDVSTAPSRSSWREAVTYFFLAPNAAQFSFPAIDFRTFCRSHYNAEALTTYQRGVLWMARGILQLVIFRWNAHAFLIRPDQVRHGADIVQYLISNYLTYLQVSGTAHFGIGFLLLFGFNLPETHHRYMLASSFTDYWRRINIYWKDFMVKVFYLPVFFRFRSGGHRRALAIATGYVFFVSWALHLWITWWLTDHTGFDLPNAAFWAFIGALVVYNVLSEDRRGRRVPSRARKRAWRDDITLLVKTGGTFLTVSVLMSLMNHPDGGDWFRMWRHADLDTAVWLGAAIGVILVAKLVMEILPERGALAPTSVLRPLSLVAASDLMLCTMTLIVLLVGHRLPAPNVALGVFGLR